MKKHQNVVENWKKAMLPLAFTFSSLLNFGFFYLGLAFQENPARQYGFIIGNTIFAVLVGITFLHIIRKERFKWYTWVLWFGVMLFYCACWISALRNYGTHFLIVDYLSQFIVFCIPAFMIGICAAKWRTEQHLVPILEKLSFFAFPAGLAFFMQVMFDANPFNWGRDLGIIGYMPFAYTLMPLLMALVIRFSDVEELIIPFAKYRVKHPQIVRFFMILVFWIAIYSSGTRGAMICVVGFLLLLLIFRMILRLKIKRTVLISAVMIAAIAFNLFVYAPPGMKWLGRMDMFLEGLKEGQIITGHEDDKVSDHIDELVGTLPPLTPTETTPTETTPTETTPTETTPTETTPTETTPVETTPPETEPVNLDELEITSRGTLFKIAIKEFLKSPITGMGAGGYSVKYEMFPHNVILELLAETGVVGTVILFAFILLALIKLFMVALKDRSVMYVFLYFITYAIQANCNGSLWFCSALLCALGYGLTLRVKDKAANVEK